MNLGQSGSCARCGTRTRRRGPILPSHQPGPSPRRGCMCHNIEPLNGVAVLVVVRLHLRTPRKGMSECAIKVDLGAWMLTGVLSSVSARTNGTAHVERRRRHRSRGGGQVSRSSVLLAHWDSG